MQEHGLNENVLFNTTEAYNRGHWQERKREPAAEGGRSIGLIGYLSVYKTLLGVENRVRAKAE